MLILEQQAEMASDCKEEIVVEGWKMLKFAAQYLGNEAFVRYFSGQLRGDTMLRVLGEDVLGELTDPFLEE